MISTRSVRLILDRNQNGLEGRPIIDVGGALASGLYWDPTTRQAVSVESGRAADRRYVLLSPRVDVTFDELVRELVMGGGGSSGRAPPYHAGISSAHH